MRFTAFVLLSFGVASLLPAQLPAQIGANWNYYGKTGPLGWGRLDPTYQACSRGHEQSPIDIRNTHLNKALAPIEFHYISGAMTLENNSHTIVVRVNPGSYIVADGVRYNLTGYEFKHPAEEAVKGKLTDMSVHLVHKSDDGKMAIVAVRLSEERGAPNAVLATLFEHLPTTAGKTEKITEMVNAGGLLPGSRSYWTYTGSLTTPPCTEGVRWYIFQEPVSLSRYQLQKFSTLFPMNTRPLQDVHGRKIEASE